MLFIEEHQICELSLLGPLYNLFYPKVLSLIVLSIRDGFFDFLEEIEEVLDRVSNCNLTPFGLLFVVIRILGLV